MKFGRTVKVNAVPEWSAYYISYSNLKKTIYALGADLAARTTGADGENAQLINTVEEASQYDIIFRKKLDEELDKISRFYINKERDLYDDFLSLQRDVHDFQINANYEETLSSGSSSISNLRRLRTEEEHAGKNSVILSSLDADNALKSSSPSSSDSIVIPVDEYEEFYSEVFDLKITLKKRAIALYVSLSELKSYIHLNRTGFRKVLKKYAKVMGRPLAGDDYLQEVVDTAYPFVQATDAALTYKTNELIGLYATVCTKGNMTQARTELKVHLREYVVWERNTVWKEVGGLHNDMKGINLTNQGLLVSSNPIVEALDKNRPLKEPFLIYTRFGTLKFPRYFFNSTVIILSIIVATFIVLLTVPIFEEPEQQSCLAILVASSMLWATEVIPLFVTSILVPLLIIVFRVVRSDDESHVRLSAPDATKYIFASMWTPVIMLLLGGFAIAEALRKYNIAKMIATWVLSNAGTKPRNVVLTTMFVAMFLSMWISNVASPVLTLSIVQPLLRTQTIESNFPKAIILGIALACNVGGMASPISSPQNIIALQNMFPQVSWGAWFFIAIPVCILSILAIWVFLLLFLNPNKGAIITKLPRSTEKFNREQYLVSGVTLVTIALWCVSHQLEGVFGDMGVLAIIPLVLFFGTGILTKKDFDNFMWTIIILAMGGIALGKAVSSSGLLDTIAFGIRSMVSGLSVYGIMAVFGALILIIATFISHTVAALILLPIVAQVGNATSDPHPNLLVMASAFLCSCAMGLPTSGFPNVTAICTTDDMGRPYLTVLMFITRGVPSSLLAYIVVITVGYGLMKVVGL
ncbi:SPX domain-containing protein [Dipodascopsis uninucleata]